METGRLKRKRTQFVPPKLMLTSMMDMFTIILTFLLCSFSSDPESIKNMKNLELPVSSTESDYLDSIKIVLSSEHLMLNDEALASVEKEKINGTDPNNLKNSSLFRKLEDLKKKQDARDDGTQKDQHVLFMCDKRHSFKTINAVIKTAGLAGFPNFQFAVLEGETD